LSKRRPRYLIFVLLLVPALAACYLVSGERSEEATPNPLGEGRLEVQFVTADGQVDREIPVGVAEVPVLVDLTVQAQQGELTLSFLDSAFNPVLSVTGRYGLEGRGSAVIQSDAQGRLLFRIAANEVREGAYTIHYQLLVLPTPTPTVTPTPEPTP